MSRASRPPGSRRAAGASSRSSNTWSSPSGGEEAPESATPSGFGGISLWIAELESLAPLLARLPAHLSGLPLEDVIYPHFLCGPLDALQRLDFIRFHLNHHIPQLERIRRVVA